MDLVIRAVLVYAFLMFVMRASGKRQFSQMTSFDLILLLIISEAVQQALLGSQDFSLTAAVVVVTTLVSIDIVLSFVKQWSKRADIVLEGSPLLLLDDGKLLTENMKHERVDDGDILESARATHGIERLNQIRYAVLETNGSISIVPK